MCSGQVFAAARRVLEQCLSGELPEQNALPQLLYLYRASARSVLAALTERANIVVCHADLGSNSARGGSLIIKAAGYIDKQTAQVTSQPGVEGNAPDATVSTPQVVSKALLEHVLFLTGTEGKAAKDKAIRLQGCTLLTALASAVPQHAALEAKLVEFSADKVPAIREKALHGLVRMKGSSAADFAIAMRTSDPCVGVRASAVRGLPLTRIALPSLLERIDDVEACVRAQVFLRLADQPEAVDELGGAALVRLIVGLSDRSLSVREAAGKTLDAWQQRAGVLLLLARCDLLGDEALSEAAATNLATHFPEESGEVAMEWLGGKRKSASGEASGTEEMAVALLSRVWLAHEAEEERDEYLNVPLLIKRARAALASAQRRDSSSTWHSFLLRQLLHVLVMADIGDEALRRQVEELAEAVLTNAPFPSVSSEISPDSNSAGASNSPSALDLGVLLFRRCYSLTQGYHAHTPQYQTLEARCSTRIVLFVSEICQPQDEGGTGGTQTADKGTDTGGEGADATFTTRLSLKLQELNTGIRERESRKASLVEQKQQAVAEEEFIKAHQFVEDIKNNALELRQMKELQMKLVNQRDNNCLRVLAILTSLLRWSHSDIVRDRALSESLHQIVQPIIGLPALSQELELSAVMAICHFCVRDGRAAKCHWCLLLELLRSLRQGEEPGRSASDRRFIRMRASVVASTLSDCARLHGGALDREMILSAASALAAAPFSARQVVLEPLCSWFLTLGHVFFETHLLEPVLEVQWALGWLLVEAFKQRAVCDADEVDDSMGMGTPEKRSVPAEGKAALASASARRRLRGASWVERPKVEEEAADEEDDDSAEATANAVRLTQFFSLIPKLPGKHGAPMLSLAAESVLESGLWRRAALLPRTVDGQARWLRGFSWPALFSFVHERLPPELRFRLWRSTLQVCVVSPEQSMIAEVPFALEQNAGEAPPGAAELVRDAIEMGADGDTLATLASRLPAPQGDPKVRCLVPQVEAMRMETARREELEELGICIDSWTPALETPDSVPPHLRMRMGKGKAKAKAKAENIIKPPLPPEAVMSPEPKRRRRIDWNIKLGMEEIAEGTSPVMNLPLQAGGG